MGFSQRSGGCTLWKAPRLAFVTMPKLCENSCLVACWSCRSLLPNRFSKEVSSSQGSRQCIYPILIIIRNMHSRGSLFFINLNLRYIYIYLYIRYIYIYSPKW